MKLVRALEQSHHFESFSESELETIANAMRVRSFEPGDDIVKEGARGEELFFIVSGMVEVSTKRDGDRRTVLGQIKSGEIFGLLALLQSSKRLATVTAVDAVEVAVLPRTAFNVLYDGPTAVRFSSLVAKQLVRDVRRMAKNWEDALGAIERGEDPEKVAQVLRLAVN